MTDQEIFDLARVAKLTSENDSVESVQAWREDSEHRISRLLRIRFGVDVNAPKAVRYPRCKIGIVHSVFNAIGGTETWCRSMIRHVPGIGGIATYDRPLGTVDVALHHGEEAIRAICRAADTVLVWGITGIHKDLFNPRPKRLIAVCHGAMESRWAFETFRNQLAWCDAGVAVNKQVAEFFNVPWIPNIVTNQGDKRARWPAPKPRVAWIHRPSAEKRPELMIEIAKQLPEPWKIMATLGDGFPQEQLPKEVSNVGMLTDEHKKRICLECSRVFLATPSDEGFGYSVAEAVEACVPVVSSPHGIALDYATQIIETTEPASWAESIQRVAKDTKREALDKLRAKLLSTYGADSVRQLWETVL